MIPVSLKMRNFMAYREAELNFAGIHLAVLTGENGAGKSTLLDAITWSLWGKARARRDDELIYLGQSEMEVEFTFALGQNVYRVVRKRDSSKRGRSELSFQVEDAGGWRTLTENSIRDTQQKINRLLHLDYDTFINSAFLLQGRADEFTTKTPGKRKEILAEILGLGIYDVYEERAKKRANEKEREAAEIKAQIQQIEEELAREAEYQQQLAEAQKAEAEKKQARYEVEQEMEKLREQLRSLNEKQRQLDDLRDRLHHAHHDLKETEEAAAKARQNIREYQARLDRGDEIQAGLARLAQVRAEVQDWQTRLDQATELVQRKHALEKAFAVAQKETESRLREAENEMERLRQQAGQLPTLTARRREVEKQVADLQQAEQTREAIRAALGNLDTEQAALVEQNRRLKEEMDDIKSNLERLREAESLCPVCQRPLDAKHQEEVLARFEQDGKRRGDQFRANKARLQAIEAERQDLQRQLAEADKLARKLPQAQAEAAQLARQIEEAEAAVAALKEAQEKATEIRRSLESRDFARQVLVEQAEVEAELERLGYDRQAHEQARQEEEALRRFETEARLLAQAEKLIAEETTRLARDEARLKRLKTQIEADQKRVAELEAETAALPEATARFNAASDRFDRMTREEREAHDRVVMIEQQLHHIQTQAKRRGKLEDKLQKVQESLGMYRELQQAFGKKGIQALLIESAIPEIEDEANRLLSRMTGGRMHIRFETQRAAKSTDSTIETLDIRIADELGTRDYELFSGGEAFRVNFAIRVAMSKVLARRAGARLQTLVIDEGFGTQDGQGRERLVEAINAIQDDFEKVIVITHIDELKEAFPTRIEVVKTPEGSRLSVV